MWLTLTLFNLLSQRRRKTVPSLSQTKSFERDRAYLLLKLDITGDGVGSSSKQACCWLAGAPPAPQTSGVCVFVCVCEGKVFPAATYLAPKEPQLKQTVFGMNLSFVRASIWSAVLCDSFPLWKKRAKNSSQWPGNAAIDFILVEKKHIKDILSLLLAPLFYFKKEAFYSALHGKIYLKKAQEGLNPLQLLSNQSSSAQVGQAGLCLTRQVFGLSGSCHWSVNRGGSTRPRSVARELEHVA